MSDNLDGKLNMRARQKALTAYEKRCKTLLKREPQEVMREIIDAFNEGRVKILPTKAQKQAHKELYEND